MFIMYMYALTAPLVCCQMIEETHLTFVMYLRVGTL